MPAYIIARVEVTDWDRYREYVARTPACLAAYGGRFIVRGGETVHLEGAHEPGRVVVTEFPTLEAATAFYHSPEYTELRKLREGAATATFFAIDGFPVEAWEALAGLSPSSGPGAA